MTTPARLTTPDIAGLHATSAQPLSFAPELSVRAFLLEREPGNLLVYNTGLLERDLPSLAEHGVERQYLGHWHEAAFGSDAPARGLGARVLVNAADAGPVREHGWTISERFTGRHALDGDFEVIPIPGHTPGASAFRWSTGGQRVLFTGDTLYVRDGEWVAGILESMDASARRQLAHSLQLLAEVEFDVLVPWATSADGPYAFIVQPGEARRRIDELLKASS